MTDIARAVALLRAGELVAFPTETVYGLGANAANPAAVAKIFAAKGRPADHPLIVHVADATQLDRWAIDIPAAATQLAAAFWPGPLTLILKRHPGVPNAVTGGQDTIGLRVPNHPLALQLLSEFGGGLAAPSANRFGRISPTTAAHVGDELGDRVSLILDGGPCAVGIESTIVDLSGDAPRVLRPGMISAAQIGEALGAPLKSESAQAPVPRVSGSLEAHYAPRTPLCLLPFAALLEASRRALDGGSCVAVLSLSGFPHDARGIIWRQLGNEPQSYARALYAALRELDALGLDLILVELPPDEEDWRGVLDRLRRAAIGSGRPSIAPLT